MTSIHTSGLSVSLAGRRVVSGVDLTVSDGEFVAILGPNGAGKTTLLRAIAGELPPESGDVSVCGESPSALTPRRRADLRAFLSQTDRTDIPFSVATTVGFGTYNSKLDEDARRALVDRRMRDLELGSIADQPVDELSGGERRRVSVARALSQDAPVLLMDEPTDSLDLAHADLVMSLAAAEARSGRSVIASSHDLNLAARRADRVVLMAGGSIVADGTASEVLTADRLSEVYRCTVIVAEHPRDGGPVVYL